MSSKKDEDKTFTRAYKETPTPRVGQQPRYEMVPETFLGQSPVYSQTSSSTYRLHQVTATGSISLWEPIDHHSVRTSAQEGHQSQESGDVLGRLIQVGSSVQRTILRHDPRTESRFHNAVEEEDLPESLVDYLLLADPQESKISQGRVFDVEGSIERKESQVRKIVHFLLEGAPIEASSFPREGAYEA